MQFRKTQFRKLATGLVIAISMIPSNIRTYRPRAAFWIGRTLCMLRLRLNDLLPYQSCAITVITPTYKRLDTLAEAMASVRAQDFQDWEHIIVADGHDPEVERLVSSFSDERIVYISTKPFHCSGNHQRNVALAASKAKYVYFLDDDNILYPHALGAMLSGFETPDIGYVVCPIEMHDRRILFPSLDFRPGEIDTLNFMTHRNICGKVGGWRRIYWADFLLIDSIRKCHKGKHLNIPPVGIHR